jgi:DNA-binding NtrC family response regulator
MSTILLAVDQDPLRALLASVLSAAGYNVIEASDATHARNLSRSCKGCIDLLCAHIDMDHMGAAALAQDLLQQYPSMRVLLVVMENPRYIVDREPAYPVLRKPFSVEQLLQTVGQALERSPVQHGRG